MCRPVHRLAVALHHCGRISQICAFLMLFTVRGNETRIHPPMQPCILMLVSAALDGDWDSSCDRVQARP